MPVTSSVLQHLAAGHRRAGTGGGVCQASEAAGEEGAVGCNVAAAPPLRHPSALPTMPSLLRSPHSMRHRKKKARHPGSSQTVSPCCVVIVLQP